MHISDQILANAYVEGCTLSDPSYTLTQLNSGHAKK